MNEHSVAAQSHQGQPNLVYIIGTYPSLTTTFIDREVASLRKLGVTLRIVSVRRPRGPLSSGQEDLQRDVIYLLPATGPSVLWAHARFALLRPRAYFGTLLYLVTRRHHDLRSRLKTLAHFAAGVFAAHRLRRYPCDHVHAHFVDRAATLALVVSRLRKVPYSVTAHANDIYVNPVLLPEKLSGARFVATCTRYNHAHLSRLDGETLARKVNCIYHGIDLDAYRPPREGRSGKPILLAVGQLKEKKGLAHLVRACGVLRDRGFDFACEIVGEGPLREELTRLIRQLGLADIVQLSGAMPHQDVVKRYARSHIFVLPCVIAGDGDRDGVPNVLLEAMAMELPIVSTPVSGIPEVVAHGVNGLLVPPGDHVTLAEALATLLDDPGTRRRFGERGRERVTADFDVERNVRQLLSRFAAHV